MDEQMLERLTARTGDSDTLLLSDIIETAKAAILNRRFPFSDWPDDVEPRYKDLQYRIALDLYNKMGAEGQLSHSENGISRSYSASWISEDLLAEITPFAGVIS